MGVKEIFAVGSESVIASNDATPQEEVAPVVLVRGCVIARIVPRRPATHPSSVGHGVTVVVVVHAVHQALRVVGLITADGMKLITGGLSMHAASNIPGFSLTV